MNFRFSSIIDSVKTVYLPIKYPLALILATASCQIYATPSNMGTVTIVNSNVNGNATGTYRTSRGDTGTFTLIRNETRGYTNIVDILAGNNGIELRNRQDISNGNDRDKFKYTFTITPNDNNAIHTIKIGQASYTTNGNSEIARQTIKYTSFAGDPFNLPPTAIIKSNEDVPYFYNAMGDYFMGSRLNSTQLNSQINTSNPQLRTDSSNANGSGLYYYNITSLTGVTGNQNPYTPTLNNNRQVSLNANNGVLPPAPTFANIIKSTSINPNNQTTYSALDQNTVISDGGTYVSYGIENTQSSYVVAVKNAQSVTLTYEGIMNGNVGISGAVIGETFNEWISFGVESEPVYNFLGTVFNDNGGINDRDADADTINGVYNNTRFFNALFEPAPASPAETGINGSTVQLADDCTKTTPIVYATKAIPDSDVGRYQFNILPSVLSGRTSVCVIETRTNPNDVSHPIRTTTNKRTVNLVANTFNYSGNDFGRVIAKNAALVLEKEQAVNSCTINSLTPLAYSKNPLVDVPPGQCIAYKITATNRANQMINNFQMQDNLQKAGVNNATVSSVLAIPTHNPDDYAPDSVKEGKNDVPVKTKLLVIAKRSNNTFYFNTKYGTTHSSP